MRRALVFAAILSAVGLPAEAAGIVCNGNFQVVAGSEISTPYCRDNNLARIGRQRGFKVSDREIRNNPSAKRELCRYLNSNIEVQTACGEVDDGRQSPGF